MVRLCQDEAVLVGACFWVSSSSISLTLRDIRSWLIRVNQQTSPRPLHNRHKHLLLPPRQCRRQHPRLPILLQLRPPKHRLDIHNPIQIRLQRLVQNGQDAWVEIPHPLLFRCRRQLLHCLRVPVYDHPVDAAVELLGHCHRNALQFFLHEG